MARSKTARRHTNGKAAKAAAKAAKVEAKVSFLDKVIDAMYYVLPLTTQREIAKACSKRMRTTVIVPHISAALDRNRETPGKYGYIINYTTPGSPTAEDEGRYCVALVDANGEVEFDAHSIKHYARAQAAQARLVTTRQVRMAYMNQNATKYLSHRQARGSKALASACTEAAQLVSSALLVFSKSFDEELNPAEAA